MRQAHAKNRLAHPVVSSDENSRQDDLQGVVLHALGVEAGHGVRGGEGLGLVAEGGDVGVVVEGGEEVLEGLASLGLDGNADLDALVDEVGNLDKVGLGETTRSERAGADADAAGHEGRLVADDGVLVEGDVGKVEDLLGLGAGQAVGAQVEEEQVVLGTARDELVAELDEARGDGVAVLLDLRYLR